MIIGTVRNEEARVFNCDAGIHTLDDGRRVEIFYHEGGHMVEADEDDDMPLDDWREPEQFGWYYRFLNKDGSESEAHGRYTTSSRALQAVLE